jgi:hypothetical protein
VFPVRYGMKFYILIRSTLGETREYLHLLAVRKQGKLFMLEPIFLSDGSFNR